MPHACVCDPQLQRKWYVECIPTKQKIYLSCTILLLLCSKRENLLWKQNNNVIDTTYIKYTRKILAKRISRIDINIGKNKYRGSQKPNSHHPSSYLTLQLANHPNFLQGACITWFKDVEIIDQCVEDKHGTKTTILMEVKVDV